MDNKVLTPPHTFGVSTSSRTPSNSTPPTKKNANVMDRPRRWLSVAAVIAAAANGLRYVSPLQDNVPDTVESPRFLPGVAYGPVYPWQSRFGR